MPRNSTKRKKDPLITVPEAVSRICEQCAKLIRILPCEICTLLLKAAEDPALEPCVRPFAFCTILDSDEDTTDSHVIVGRQALTKLSRPPTDTLGADQVSSSTNDRKHGDSND